ncbi:hypothetical protein [Nitriliruptor alkaliphilus]|nr:hypothetical protein [Nitriliruptor alkaliphilus]
MTKRAGRYLELVDEIVEFDEPLHPATARPRRHPSARSVSGGGPPSGC